MTIKDIEKMEMLIDDRNKIIDKINRVKRANNVCMDYNRGSFSFVDSANIGVDKSSILEDARAMFINSLNKQVEIVEAEIKAIK